MPNCIACQDYRSRKAQGQAAAIGGAQGTAAGRALKRWIGCRAILIGLFSANAATLAAPCAAGIVDMRAILAHPGWGAIETVGDDERRWPFLFENHNSLVTGSRQNEARVLTDKKGWLQMFVSLTDFDPDDLSGSATNTPYFYQSLVLRGENPRTVTLTYHHGRDPQWVTWQPISGLVLVKPGNPGDILTWAELRGSTGFRSVKAGGAVHVRFSMLLDGDFNVDGTVDTADSVLWRNTLGSRTDLRADGNGNGIVDEPDYEIWRASFGDSASVGMSNAPGPLTVPEPPTFLVLIASLTALSARHRRRRA